ILSALDQSGQADNTVVVYVSDHGDMMGDHGLWTKQVMYEASAGIPPIVAGPGVPVGKRVRTGTSLVDLAATAIDVTAATDSSDVHSYEPPSCQALYFRPPPSLESKR
ncbi:MAG: sulfatase-like hydrolase/transferase, partial [Acidobacteria bacterium]|nr:sulfatase-like hydrolase/transferase [Acidobacteriota bacterium]